MNGKFIFITNDDKQNYPFCTLNYQLKGLDAAIRMPFPKKKLPKMGKI